MTNGNDETDDDIAHDVLPIEVAEPAVPVELNQLYPWHRPRKQVIRERQWISLSRYLIRKLENSPSLRPDSSGVREVRYLTLPGIDYLDVRMLGECCKELDCDLTSTGYLAVRENTPERARAQFREESLIEAGHITSGSYTFGRRLEDITSTSGQAYRELRRRGPFHIVNIDACGSIALPRARHAQRMVDAIYRIVEFQFEACNGKWLLFITADVTREGLAAETVRNLSQAIVANAQENDEFENGVISVLSDSADSLDVAIEEASAESGERFLRLFSLGFAKWLLHLAINKGWNLKMHDSYFYSTMPDGSDEPTMPCLAFEFIPPDRGLVDEHEVTRADPAATATDENTAMRVVNKVSTMTNIDHQIQADGGLRLEMISRTKNLLQEAGYAASALADLDLLDTPASAG